MKKIDMAISHDANGNLVPIDQKPVTISLPVVGEFVTKRVLPVVMDFVPGVPSNQLLLPVVMEEKGIVAGSAESKLA